MKHFLGRPLNPTKNSGITASPPFTPAHVTEYCHRPLSTTRSIRIIQLLPSHHHDAPLRCRIHEVSLDDSGRRYSYQALSYVWGSETLASAIYCDDDQVLHVTENCRDALHRLRLRFRTRSLWIDAICIDQTNRGLSERSFQIKLMGEIYQRAQRVIVWLGSGTEHIPQLFRLLYLIGRLFQLNSVFLPFHARVSKPITGKCSSLHQSPDAKLTFLFTRRSCRWW